MIPFEYIVYGYIVYGVLLQALTWDFIIAMAKARVGSSALLSPMTLSVIMVVAIIMGVAFWIFLVPYSMHTQSARKIRNIDAGRGPRDDAP